MLAMARILTFEQALTFDMAPSRAPASQQQQQLQQQLNQSVCG